MDREQKMQDLKIIEGDGKTGQEKGTAIRDLRDRYLVEEEQMLGKLFVGYFNNKMAVLVFLMQVQKHKPDAKVIVVCVFFSMIFSIICLKVLSKDVIGECFCGLKDF